MSDQFDVIIVGAGQAGAQTAISLRQGKFTGSIGIIGREDYFPYERPPLSKEFLMGEKDEERLFLRPDIFWSQNDITVLTGQTVTDVRTNEKQIATFSGRTIGYQKLVWAAGGDPRPLPIPGADADCVRYIRTLNDIKNIRANLDQIQHVAIIGGGYIGLEAAAVLRKLGKDVILIEVADRLLGRVCAEPVSTFYHQAHTENGLSIRLNTRVEEIVSKDQIGALLKLHESDETIDCDLVIVGIGIDPCVAVLQEAGAAVNDGVLVDQFCQTSLACVYAIGDCAYHENVYAGGARVRLESVQNAIDQGKVVARHIIEKPAPYTALPWFWSDQYDLKLQTIGLNIGYDETVLRGDPLDRSFSLIYMKNNEVVAIDAINRTIDYAQGRLLINKGIKPDADDLANPLLPLKDIALNSVMQTPPV